MEGSCKKLGKPPPTPCFDDKDGPVLDEDEDSQMIGTVGEVSYAGTVCWF